MPDTITISELIPRVQAQAAQQCNTPVSTYRLQFNSGFTFRDAAALAPYLAKLGVSHVYASPYLTARAGSTHGYDVIDHCRINREIGSADDFHAFLAALKANGLSHILDTVPNHVGISAENVWWNDVLESGPQSIYSDYFDISWSLDARAAMRGKVLLPLLGGPFGAVLERGELKLRFVDGALEITYFDQSFPVSARSHGTFLKEAALAAAGFPKPELLALAAAFDELAVLDDQPAARPHRREQFAQHKRRLATLIAERPAIAEPIEQTLARYNGTPGLAASFDRLDALLAQQHYRLAWWRTAPDEINYRQFFDNNDLLALRMERPEVFQATQSFTLALAASGAVTGLRIDHPDGLFHPAEYFQRLQVYYLLEIAKDIVTNDASGAAWENIADETLRELRSLALDRDNLPLYVVGEKILAQGEALRSDWATHGTSGYDFLIAVNGLFVDPSNQDAFTEIYQQFTGNRVDFNEQAYRDKLQILDISLASELHMLGHQVHGLAQRTRGSRDFSLYGLIGALREIIACFEVYRTYIGADGVRDVDRRHVERAVAAARLRQPRFASELFDFIQETLLLAFGQDDEGLRDAQRAFVGKFQQLTSPVMAKGVEDTSFYIYNRLLSLNEVGGEPARFGATPRALHEFFQIRQRDWPATMNTLSTHDTKRSEDVRARISALSEIPREWHAALERWSTMNAQYETRINGQAAPDRNEQYALYQQLLGIWPAARLDAQRRAEFARRIQQATTKAMREAKVYSLWTQPDGPHEKAVARFIDALLDEAGNAAFTADFTAFARRVAHLGRLNSMSQSVLKLTAPGVPDTYQGNELWDFSLVDPDNRRPVDYARCAALLQTSEQASGQAAQALLAEPDGAAKMRIHAALLRLRRDRPGLFMRGSYQPAFGTDVAAEHVFAFVRSEAEQHAVVIVPRLCAALADRPDEMPLGASCWKASLLQLPPALGGKTLHNVLTHESLDVPADGMLSVAAALANFPVAVLVSQ